MAWFRSSSKSSSDSAATSLDAAPPACRSSSSRSFMSGSLSSGGAPESLERLAELLDAMRAALGTGAADVERQLLTGGEEGLTDTQLRR